jgi:hypothetical protein
VADYPVTNGDVVTNLGTKIGVQDRVVLDVRSGADLDFSRIGPDHDTGPNA